MARTRAALVVPTIGCILAGWRSSQAMAMAVAGTPRSSAISSMALVQFRELVVVQEDAIEEAVLEGRPGLDGDVVQTAIFQDAAVAHDRAVDLHVDVEAAVDHARVGQAELKLIGDQRLFDVPCATVRSDRDSGC